MNTRSISIPFTGTPAHAKPPQHPAVSRALTRGESANLRWARACAREAQLGNQLETWSLLFFGASALALMAGCAFHLERFVAHWSSFEDFVHAMLR